LSRRHFPLNGLKYWNFGNRKPDCPSVVLKNKPLQGIRIPDVNIRAVGCSSYVPWVIFDSFLGL
jgi:hypothetical protein